MESGGLSFLINLLPEAVFLTLSAVASLAFFCPLRSALLARKRNSA